MRTDRFKYMLSGDNEEGFFDLTADPYELDNLAGDPLYAKDLQNHRNRLIAWMQQVGDTHDRPKQ